jgi:hypothetical protein
VNSFVDTHYIFGERRNCQTVAKRISDTFFASRPVGTATLARAIQ